MGASFRGLTWDHPRGYDALAAAASLAGERLGYELISWDKQPLEGFESTPLPQLAAEYDLLVLDHPHIGEAVAAECLWSLDKFFSVEQLREWDRQSVGKSMTSYFWSNRYWALPLDVAAQTMVLRPDLVASCPESWDEIVTLAEDSGTVAQSLGGPHAFLNLLSLAGSRGQRLVPDCFLPDDLAIAVIEHMGKLYQLRPNGSEELNPIGLLERMSTTDTISLVPYVFGYVNYAVATGGARQLWYTNAIRDEMSYGGVLGGTGIGISRRAKPDQELLAHISWLLDSDTQSKHFPEHNGQPANWYAWLNDEVNESWGNFYRDTVDNTEQALLRPRFTGYIKFQSTASQIVRTGLAAGTAAGVMLEQLRSLWLELPHHERATYPDSEVNHNE